MQLERQRRTFWVDIDIDIGVGVGGDDLVILAPPPTKPSSFNCQPPSSPSNVNIPFPVFSIFFPPFTSLILSQSQTRSSPSKTRGFVTGFLDIGEAAFLAHDPVKPPTQNPEITESQNQHSTMVHL